MKDKLLVFWTGLKFWLLVLFILTICVGIVVAGAKIPIFGAFCGLVFFFVIVYFTGLFLGQT